AVNRLRPDIVLLDVQLPDRDGFAVAEQLARGEVRPTVVLISSRDASSYRQRLIDSPARGFLPKSELTAAAFSALVAQASGGVPPVDRPAHRHGRGGGGGDRGRAGCRSGSDRGRPRHRLDIAGLRRVGTRTASAASALGAAVRVRPGLVRGKPR